MTETNGESRHIFISYARKDGSNHADTLQHALEARGYACWRDVHNLHRMQDFTAEIENAIQAASHVVVCVTPDVRRADSFVRREIAFAQICQRPITPLILAADAIPPISIVNNTWVEQHKLGWDKTIPELETCFKQGEIPPPHPDLAADPFRDYLQALLKNLVADLDRMVIKQIDLHGAERPDAVTGHPKPKPTVKQTTLSQSFFGRGLSVNEPASPPKMESTPDHDGIFDTLRAVFDHYDGRVLLLGEPGAGKTTTLMAYARDAVSDRLADPTQPLPIPAILSAWPSHNPPELADWLARANGDFPGLAQQIRNGNALLLLDGLDELGSRCEEEIEGESDKDGNPKTRTYDPRQRFLDHIPADNQILITCRIRDYEQIGQKAALNGAVTLQPLTLDQMRDYLEGYPELWAAIESDDTLRELCTTPLLLSIFAYGFKESTEAERQALQNLADSPADLRDRIFGMYVERRYEHEHLRAETMGETLPFTLDEIYQALGEAIKNRLTFDGRLMNVANTVPMAQDVAAITQLCTHLHYLTPFENEETGESDWRFTHLLLRAHFGFPMLINHLGDANKHVRSEAVTALGNLGDSRAVDPLIACLDDEDWIVRTSAAEALGNLGDSRVVDPLIASLRDESGDGGICSSVAEALGKLGEPAVQPLIACLGDEDLDVRYWAVAALGYIGDTRAVDPLITYMKDANASVRFRASEALGYIGDTRAVDPLISCLSDESIDVRYSAAVALGCIGDIRAVDPLITCTKDANASVRRGAAMALGKIGDDRAVEPLIVCLGNEDCFVHTSAAEALGKLGDARAVSPLLACLGNEDWIVRTSAAEALGRLGDARAVSPLLACLGDADESVRNNTAEALEAIGTPKAFATMKAWKADKDNPVKFFVKWRLRNITFRVKWRLSRILSRLFKR